MSRLERGHCARPTLNTVAKYALAVGARVPLRGPLSESATRDRPGPCDPDAAATFRELFRVVAYRRAGHHAAVLTSNAHPYFQHVAWTAIGDGEIMVPTSCPELASCVPIANAWSVLVAWSSATRR